MVAKLTGKYIKNGIIDISEGGLEPSVDFKGEGQTKFSIYWQPITKPFLMVEDNHSHNFDQYLFFIGGNPKNIIELGGEVELTLSEDGKKLEKHIINTASSVYVPKGLFHCPLNFKRVDNPFFFIDLYLAPEYSRMK